MRLLTDRQRKRIRDIITDRHLALIVELCGADAIPKEDFERLQKAGKVKLPKTPIDLVTAAHLLGHILGDAKPEIGEKLEPTQFWQMAKHDDLTDLEHEAILIAKAKLGEHIRGLGSKVETGISHALVDEDDKLRKKRLLAIRKEGVRGVEERRTIKSISRSMKKVTGDALRDWMRVAHTEMHNITEEGKAVVIAKLKRDDDPLVYKQPRPDACPFCKHLYLKANGTPRVFRLSELMANGTTNTGRKAGRPTSRGRSATEWKPVIGSTHPWCQCTLHYLPAGMAFDNNGKLKFVGMKKSYALVESLDKAFLDHECEEGHA